MKSKGKGERIVAVFEGKMIEEFLNQRANKN